MGIKTSPRSFLSSIVIVALTTSVIAQIWTSIGQKNRAEDMGQLRMVWNAFSIYASDYDDTTPLAVGRRSNGSHAWNFNYYVPADWPAGGGSDTGYAARIVFSKYLWATSIIPYGSNPAWYRSPGTPVVDGGPSGALRGGPSEPALVSYSYPGTLNQYSVAAIRSPEKFPFLWQGFGKAALNGYARANPGLNCSDATQACKFVPSRTGCSTIRNGEQSSMFTVDRTVWVYDKTSTWMSVDGTASFRALGARITPDNTDQNIDPYNGYNSEGLPGFFWWDTCHAWLFRPDAEY